MVVLNQARFDVIKLGPVLHRHTMSCSVLVFHTENSESFLSPHKELHEPANFYKGKKTPVNEDSLTGEWPFVIILVETIYNLCEQ